jgi:dual specificity phosphatase 12
MQCDFISEIVTYPLGTGTSTIYLSGIDVVQQLDALRQYDIQVVLSFTRGTISDLTQTSSSIRHYIFEIDDHPLTNIYPLFEKCYAIIMSAIQQKQNILVHCRAGVSRSVTILASFFLTCLRCNPELVIPYIRRTQQTWTESILEYIQHKRGCINPNPGFRKQLLQYEQVILPQLNCKPRFQQFT